MESQDPQIKVFMFESKWTIEDNYPTTVLQGWEDARREEALSRKLGTCGSRIAKWAEDNVGNTKKRIKGLLQEIDLIKTNEGREEVAKPLEREAEKLLMQEEMYWHQRAKKH